MIGTGGILNISGVEPMLVGPKDHKPSVTLFNISVTLW